MYDTFQKHNLMRVEFEHASLLALDRRVGLYFFIWTGIEQGDMWQDYLSKAEHNLAAAERDLESGSYDPCVSRAYFAAFQAAISALLALTDFQRRGRYWDHGEIAAEFVRRLIHRQKVFPRRQPVLWTI